MKWCPWMSACLPLMPKPCLAATSEVRMHYHLPQHWTSKQKVAVAVAPEHAECLGRQLYRSILCVVGTVDSFVNAHACPPGLAPVSTGGCSAVSACCSVGCQAARGLGPLRPCIPCWPSSAALFAPLHSVQPMHIHTLTQVSARIGEIVCGGCSVVWYLDQKFDSRGLESLLMVS